MPEVIRHLLSDAGSTRATAYNWSNKTITLGGKTHVVWLDAVATVCGRTYDHATGSWSETVRPFEGADNHANPCLAADAEGRLHLTWGPHGWWVDWNQARVKWAMASKPGVLDHWDRQDSFGYNATAGNIVHLPSGLDAVICRGGESPAATMFHRQRELGGWTNAMPLFIQNIEPQYTHHYGQIAVSDDGVLYAGCHFYNVGGGDNQPVTGDQSRMSSAGAAALKSTDAGDTWQTLAGQTVRTPVEYSEAIAIPPLHSDIRLCSLAVAPQGTLWALVIGADLKSSDIILTHWDDASDQWIVHNLAAAIPEDRTAIYGSMTVDNAGRVHVAISAPVTAAAKADGETWAHRSSEIFHIATDAQGENAVARQISETSNDIASWLPVLSRRGPFQPVDQPVLLYTQGIGGTGCSPEDHTKVWCVFLED